MDKIREIEVNAKVKYQKVLLSINARAYKMISIAWNDSQLCQLRILK